MPTEDSNMPEIWKTIPEWSNYEVSNLSRVRRAVAGRTRRPGGIIKPQRYKRGYIYVPLCQNGIERKVYIHALVASAFIGPRPVGFQVNHIDTDPTNNHVSNLEYVTPSGNQQHSAKLGRRPKGHNVNTSKLTKADVVQIRQMFKEGMGGPSIAKMFGIKHQSAYAIRDRKQWKHIP